PGHRPFEAHLQVPGPVLPPDRRARRGDPGRTGVTVTPSYAPMKPAAVQALRRTLAADRPAFGLWVTLEAPSVSEMAVALGLDWVVIDAEHGHLDWKAITEHLRAAVRSETVALVRVAEMNGDVLQRAAR